MSVCSPVVGVRPGRGTRWVVYLKLRSLLTEIYDVAHVGLLARWVIAWWGLKGLREGVSCGDGVHELLGPGQQLIPLAAVQHRRLVHHQGVTVVNGQNVTVSVGSVGVGVGRVVVVWGW